MGKLAEKIQEEIEKREKELYKPLVELYMSKITEIAKTVKERVPELTSIKYVYAWATEEYDPYIIKDTYFTVGNDVLDEISFGEKYNDEELEDLLNVLEDLIENLIMLDKIYGILRSDIIIKEPIEITIEFNVEEFY